jgi:hypothetical protein
VTCSNFYKLVSFEFTSFTFSRPVTTGDKAMQTSFATFGDHARRARRSTVLGRSWPYEMDGLSFLQNFIVLHFPNVSFRAVVGSLNSTSESSDTNAELAIGALHSSPTNETAFAAGGELLSSYFWMWRECCPCGR